VLTDQMWARLQPLLPPLRGPRGKPVSPRRPVAEGIVFRNRTGVPWRDLPKQFGHWQTV